MLTVGCSDQSDPPLDVEAESLNSGDGRTATERAAAATQPADVGDDNPAAEAETIPVEELTGVDLERHLARRYEAFWLAFDGARSAPSSDPALNHPQLAAFATGDQLEAAYAELEGLAASGQALREPDQAAVPGLDNEQSIRVRVDLVDGVTAQLAACVVNDMVVYQTDDDTVVNAQVLTVEGAATMVFTDGAWKVLRSQAVDLQQGVGGCWDDGAANFPW